jgi:hypothetical protein
MATSLLFPLEQIKPSQILSQYSEWIYFTLVLVFFVSISGIALKRHFDKPYVKPLIISVGLMFTFGAFRFRDQMTNILESWGILGSILLFSMVATIPYGLCRGFGVSAGRAFFLSYILIYILSWVKFPGFYESLGDRNLGLVNLGLLVLFIVAIIKVVKFGKLRSFASKSFSAGSPFAQEIDREIGIENQERRLITGGAEKMTKLEIRSMEDVSRAIDSILQIIETHRNNLPKEERANIADLLHRISKDEDIFMKNARRLHKLFQRLGAVDAQHFQGLKGRLENTIGKEKKIVKAEIEREEEKLRVERAVFEFERKLRQALNSFNQHMTKALDHIRSSPYPYDAIHPLSDAKTILSNMLTMIKDAGQLEENLVSLVNAEKRLLKNESSIA